MFEAIGNKPGKFISMEENWETKLDCRCAIILVEMDLRNGFHEELKIVMHGSTWRQKLDYWKIPFKCFNCREVGHMQKDCPKVATKLIYKNIWIKKDKQLTMGNDSNVFKEKQGKDQYEKQPVQDSQEIKHNEKGKNVEMDTRMSENDQDGKDN